MTITNNEKENNSEEKSKGLNELGGKKWLKYSISVWDIIKTPEERKLKHPAMFPKALCERLIEIFTREGDIIFDPFSGSGSTLIASENLKRKAIGFEINKDFIKLYNERSEQKRILSDFGDEKQKLVKIYNKNANSLDDILKEESIDLCITSPPYWDILRMKRSADNKEIRPYSDDNEDLGNIENYEIFLSKLKDIFKKIYKILKYKKFCIVILMDIRKKNKLYPFHIDAIRFMEEIGFTLDDIIIWNRSMEYNNLRPLGYPHVFRVNRIHEYILLFQKRKEN